MMVLCGQYGVRSHVLLLCQFSKYAGDDMCGFKYPMPLRYQTACAMRDPLCCKCTELITEVHLSKFLKYMISINPPLNLQCLPNEKVTRSQIRSAISMIEQVYDPMTLKV